MVKAVWNGKAVAESEETVVVEGNHYFPRDAVNAGYLEGQRAVFRLPVEGPSQLPHP